MVFVEINKLLKWIWRIFINLSTSIILSFEVQNKRDGFSILQFFNSAIGNRVMSGEVVPLNGVVPVDGGVVIGGGVVPVYGGVVISGG